LRKCVAKKRAVEGARRRRRRRRKRRRRMPVVCGVLEPPK